MNTPVWTPDLLTVSRMDAAERAVFNALWPCFVGRARAIARVNLVEHTGLPDREVREALKSLAENHGVPIGSAVSPPSGYFIINTRAEAADVYRTLRSYGLSSLQRAAAIRAIVATEDLRRIQSELPFNQNLRN